MENWPLKNLFTFPVITRIPRKLISLILRWIRVNTIFMGYYSYQGGRDMKKVLRKMIEICACRMVRNRLMAEAMKKSR